MLVAGYIYVDRQYYSIMQYKTISSPNIAENFLFYFARTTHYSAISIVYDNRTFDIFL